jgi:hypothetical protein
VFSERDLRELGEEGVAAGEDDVLGELLAEVNRDVHHALEDHRLHRLLQALLATPAPAQRESPPAW